ncbi:MAG: substrate-binding domain-containing protein, partial [Pseudomonadota bacterium]
MRITRLMTAGMFVAALAAAADAQTVSLTSKNGTMTLTGKLIELDDEQFHIRTEFGNMWVARDLVTCAGTGCPGESGKVGLIIHGSDTMGKDLMPMLVEGYVDALGTHVATRSQEGSNTTNLHIKDNAPDGRDVAIVAVQAAGPDAGLTALVEDVTDIAMATRPARAAEVQAIADQGRGNLSDIGQEYVIAADAAMPIISPDVRMDALSLDDLAAIFSGKVTNWSQLGGPNLPILAHTPGLTSSARTIFQEQVLAPLSTGFSERSKIVPSEKVLADLVATTPGAIGLISATQPHNARAIDILEVCGIRRPANEFTVKTHEYPLQRRLRLFTDNTDLPDLARGLLDFTLTPAADMLIQDAGFMSLDVQRERAGNATERFT